MISLAVLTSLIPSSVLVAKELPTTSVCYYLSHSLSLSTYHKMVAAKTSIILAAVALGATSTYAVPAR